MAIDSNVLQEVVDALKQDPEIKNNVYQATVSRIDGEGVVWVNIAGSDTETPTAITSAEVAPGDSVNVEWRNNKLYIGGNYSNPSAGVVRVANVEQIADVAVANASRAQTAAANAEAYAQDAKETADAVHDIAVQASEDATAAQTAAGNAQTSATAAGQAASRAQAAADAAQGDIDEQKEYFWHDALGAHILSDTDEVTGTRYRTDIQGAGQEIFELNNGTEKSVAKFGASGARIGKEYEFGANNESHLIINNNSMQLMDKTGESYVYISEVDSAPFTSVSTFTNTTSQVFTVTYPIDTINSVKVNGVSAGYTITGSKTVTLTSAPLSPSTVEISYTTTSFGKRYTFGYREEGTTIGDMSFAEGMNIEASGKYSHAEGNGSRATGAGSHAENDAIASGSYSHAEGSSTKSSGSNSHAEGINSESSGDYSHAQNYDTIAASDSQTALGKYNVADSADIYACIIGNGTADNARSNALTVDWSGNVEAAGDVTDGASNTLSSVASTVSGLTTIETYTLPNTTYVNDSIIKKCGNIVSIYIKDFKNLPQTTLTTIGTLPAGWRPASQMNIDDINANSPTKVYRLVINTTGVMQLYNYSTATGSTVQNASIHCTYIATQ